MIATYGVNPPGQTEAWVATIAALENELRAALGEATTLTHGIDDKGKPVVLATWKKQERKGYYVQPTEFRKLNITKLKGTQ